MLKANFSHIIQVHLLQLQAVAEEPVDVTKAPVAVAGIGLAYFR